MVSTSKYNKEGVRKERLGWRDEWMSKHHRTLGANCPCFDIDCVEWRFGEPVALIDWKYAYDMSAHYLANIYEKCAFSLQSQAHIAQRLGIPAFILFYNRHGTYWLYRNEYRYRNGPTFLGEMNEDHWREWNNQDKFE
jgi:hypothetical protein